MRQFTKDASVERVKPLALLESPKVIGSSEKVVGTRVVNEFDRKAKEEWRAGLFVKYAKRLIACSESIYADERLFYTPVPLPLTGAVRRGRAYSLCGSELTLGHIIVWWENYRCANVIDESGDLCPICGFRWGTQPKFGYKPEHSEPDKVVFIAINGERRVAQVDTSLMYLACSLNEVQQLYERPIAQNRVFDIEDAIDLLLGEKVYHREEI